MTNRSLRHLFRLWVLTSATLLAITVPAHMQDRDDDDRQGASVENNGNGRHDDDNDDRREQKLIVRLPTGQYVTPTAIKDAVQQFLNPGLPAYPDFVAGEAVRSQLSPDGSTLAILTAGQ